MKHTCIALLLLLCVFTGLSAQNQEVVDSLNVQIAILEKKNPDSMALADLYIQMGEAYFFADYSKVIDYNQKALDIYEKHHDLMQQTRAITNLGKAYAYQNLYDIAVTYMQQSYEILVKLKEVNAQAYTLSDIGNVFFARAQYDIALIYYHRCEKIFGKSGDNYGLAVAYNNIGLCLVQTAHKKEALDYFYKAYELRKPLGQPFLLQHSLNFIANTYMEMDDFSKAKEAFHQALQHFHEIKQVNAEHLMEYYTTLNNLSICARKQKDFASAHSYLEEVISKTVSPGEFQIRYEAFSSLGDLFLDEGKFNEAHIAYQDAYKLIKTTNIYTEQWNILAKILFVLQKMGKHNELGDYIDTMYRIHYSILKENDRTDATKLYAAIESFNIDQENALLKKQRRMMIQSGILIFMLFASIVTLIVRQNKLNRMYTKQLEILSNSTFDGIFIHRQGLIVFTNAKMSRITGYSNHELIGKSIREILTEQGKKEFDDRKDEVINSGTEFQHEISLLTKTGEQIDMEMYSQPTRYQGYPARVVALRDITERKKYIRQILDTQDKLSELVTTKDRLFSIIAHDLKTPFNAIIGFSELMYKQFDTMSAEELKELVGYIRESGLTAYDLLQNLLSWSLSQTGKMQFYPQQLLLKLISTKVCSLNANQAMIKDIRLIDEVPAEIEVFADREMLETILRNLLSNAIKYTRQNGCVTITAQSVEDGTYILVKDTGIGMSEAELNQVMSDGLRQSVPGTNNERGTGLGLVLCKELAQKHGGFITASSQVSQGTEFTVFLPNQAF